MAKAKKSVAATPSHVDRRGLARMVDVSGKGVTVRKAVASAEVRLAPKTLALIHDGKLPKGDVLGVARIAGIQAAKRTSELIPLCHPLPIDAVNVEIVARGPDRLHIEATATVRARTGVEMEVLIAASVTALTIYDMCKSVDRGIVIELIRLEEKSGGRTGRWRRSEE